MKKKNLKSLKLNKKSISKINDQQIVGGTYLSFETCPPYACGSEDCPSAINPPHCFVRESEYDSCECPGN